MSLADELLADFEDLAQEQNEAQTLGDVQTKADTESNNVDNKKSVFYVAKLLQSKDYKEVMENLSKIDMKMPINTSIMKTSHPEYELVVKSNTLLANIDTEISIVYKFLKDLYNKRFPELESLVTSAAEYIQTVHYLGNITDSVKLDGIDFLPPAIKMVVTVTASTSLGEKLTDEQIVYVNEACQYFFDLMNLKVKIMEFIQSRMTFIAPNLCRLVGPNCAAEIMGAAGGLNVLQQMPACNILLLGSQKRSLVGFSSASVLPHTGFIYFSPLVQKMPPQYRKKAARVIASKVTLAIRVDGNREHTDGSYGEQLIDEINKKCERWVAPPPVKMVKALPIPGDQPRRKRGGRRQRHAKQKYSTTELRKQANRVYFGQLQEDLYQDSVGFGLNSLVQSGSGKVRAAAIDTKTKISISKRLQKNLASMNNTFGTRTMMRSNVSGLASSVAFTPVQGLEIVNPNVSEKDPKLTNEAMKYFSNKSGFQSSKHINPGP